MQRTAQRHGPTSPVPGKVAARLLDHRFTLLLRLLP